MENTNEYTYFECLLLQQHRECLIQKTVVRKFLQILKMQMATNLNNTAVIANTAIQLQNEKNKFFKMVNEYKVNSKMFDNYFDTIMILKDIGANFTTNEITLQITIHE